MSDHWAPDTHSHTHTVQDAPEILFPPLDEFGNSNEADFLMVYFTTLSQ
jgi:hypothetical protein